MLQKVNPFSGVSASGSAITSGSAIFSNSNGVTFGASGNTITASVQPGGVGLSAGSQSVNSGTVLFENSNGISFGMGGSSAITASYTVPNTNGLISAINVSAGSTSNNLSALTFSNSNGLSFGLNGSTLTGAYSVPTVTNSSLTLSDHNTSITAAQLAFSQGNGLTLSLSTGLGGSATLVGSYTVPSTAGLISDINVSAGNTSNNLSALTFSNSNGVSFGLNGSTLTASIASQTVQTQNCVDLSLSGNTSGTLALISLGTAILAGGNNITLSQNGQSITISGANVGGAQTGISGIADGAHTQSVGTLSFSNANGVTFGLSTGANTGTLTASVAAQSNQIEGFYALGNTNLTSSTTTDARSISIGGAGIITVGYSSNSGLIISATTNQSVQTQNLIDVSLSGNTSGTLTLVSSGTLILAGGNNITLSQHGQSVTISGANVGGAQTGISSVIASGGTQTAGAISFSNANGITFGMSTGANTGTITASYTVPLVTNSSWTVSDHATSLTVVQLAFSQSNGLTLSLSTTTGGSATVVGSYTVPSTAGLISAINVSAGTTSNNLSAITFSNSNGVSFGLNASTITASVAVQSNQTGNLYILDNTTLNSSSSSYNATSLVIDALGLAYGAAIAGGFVISVPYNILSLYVGGNTIANSSSLVDVRSLEFLCQGNITGEIGAGGVVTLSGGQSVQTQNCVDVTLAGNTTGTLALISSGTLTLAGGSNITLSQNGNAVTVVGASGGGGGSVNFSAGTTSNNLASVVFSNSNLVSFGLNGSTITGSVPNTSQLSATGWASISTNGNTISLGASTTAQFYATGATFGTSSGTGGIDSMSMSGASGIQIAASNSGWVVANIANSVYEPVSLWGVTGTTYSSHNPASYWFNRINLVDPIAFQHINVVKSLDVSVPAATSVASSGSDKYSYTHGITIFSRQNYGASSTNLTMVATASIGFTASISYNTGSVSAGSSWVTDTTGGTTSFSTTSNATNWSSYFTGPKLFPIPCVTTLGDGEYFLAHAHSSTASTNNSAVTLMSVSNLHLGMGGSAGTGVNTLGVLGSSGIVASLAPNGAGQGIASAITTNNTMPMSVISAATQQFWYCNFSNA